MEFQIIKSVEEMAACAEALRMAGFTLSIVPTMGFLHEGHLELMRIAKKESDKLIVSIFVNPAQFGPGEDFEKYPRDTEGDLDKSRSVGADIVFLPSALEMYPDKFQTYVEVEKVSQGLCALSRPHHFRGVTTVVSKLFNITKPHVAVFGQKDYQQLTVISRMVMDLNMDIRIIGVPIVREADGLAMSSRNKYLNLDERQSALCLKKSLDLADRMVKQGEKDSAIIKTSLESFINKHPFTKIDYISFCNPVTLEEIDAIGEETLLALAVKVGETRLIDNCVLRNA